ncbi:M24 family metallopeptidase, partial [Massilia sp.]|uniref:M24 family metallopeptidase n=1 Tax=Massilia sp. TaxID=1882437 RepID=UPI0028A5E6B4
GVFSAPQRQLYELVLRAQDAALAAIQAGRPYSDFHEAAVKVLAEGMLDFGLLDRAKYGSVENVLAERAHTQFYMHGTGHWLGLDVHDAGAYRDLAAEGKPSRPLMPGMALTVEPGIYVRPAPGVPEQFWNIGIRIEDNVIVGEAGPQVISGTAPKTVAEIETLMGGQ